jgi:hypothetical protein
VFKLPWWLGHHFALSLLVSTQNLARRVRESSQSTHGDDDGERFSGKRTARGVTTMAGLLDALLSAKLNNIAETPSPPPPTSPPAGDDGEAGEDVSRKPQRPLKEPVTPEADSVALLGPDFVQPLAFAHF